MALLTACKDEDVIIQGTNATDDAFIVLAAMANAAEIQAGELAATKGTTEEIRNFAQMMVTDHTAAQDELRNIADDLGHGVVDTLDAIHKLLVLELTSRSGREFDSLYIVSQVLDHISALALYEDEESDGENDLLQTFATSKIPIINTHLTQVQALALDFE